MKKNTQNTATSEWATLSPKEQALCRAVFYYEKYMDDEKSVEFLSQLGATDIELAPIRQRMYENVKTYEKAMEIYHAFFDTKD